MSKHLLYTRADGGLSVFSAAPDARLDGETAEECLARLMPLVVPADASSSRIVDATDLPADATFRDAWRDDGVSVQVDMEQAREIHMGRIRKSRNTALQALDVDYMRALEQGDATAQQAIATEKQRLRDIPETFDITVHETPEALADAWPAGLTQAP